MSDAKTDRTTRWIADNWRTPHVDDPDVWFAMVIARFVNWPDTLAALGYPGAVGTGTFPQSHERAQGA